MICSQMHAEEAIEDYTHKCAAGMDDNSDVVIAHALHDDEDYDDNSYKV